LKLIVVALKYVYLSEYTIITIYIKFYLCEQRCSYRIFL